MKEVIRKDTRIKKASAGDADKTDTIRIGAAYIRVSTEDQMEFSPDSQLKRIQEYAGQHGIQIPEEYVFVDEGISGRTASKRPAFQNMIRLARTRQAFQTILVWKFSRFARNRQDSIFYKSMLRKDCGIEVISITEPLSHDPTSMLIEALLEAMDEYYSINLAQEVRRGMQERFSRGKAISIPPFGYRMGEESFEPDPEQAKWVTYMFEAYAAGDSLSHIADILEQAGVLTNRGNLFQPRSITYILMNPVYIGKLRKSIHPQQQDSSVLTTYNRRYDRFYEHSPMDYVDGIHPPLIEQSLWNQAQERRHTEHLSYAGSHACPLSSPYADLSSNSSPVYFLQGLVHCSHCGAYLVHIHKGTAFQCSNYNHGKCKVSHYVKREQLELLVREAVTPLLPPAIAFSIHNPHATTEEKNEILKQIGRTIIYDRELKKVGFASDN